MIKQRFTKRSVLSEEDDGEVSRNYRVVVIGSSAGGFESISGFLAELPENFPIPVLVAQHLPKEDNGGFVRDIKNETGRSVIQALDKMHILPGNIYFAPADYHMLLEANGQISLSIDEPVTGSRPSIDLLFKSAAHAMREDVIGIIMSGANYDGTSGMRAIMHAGGLCFAQSPEEALFPLMPRMAINSAGVKHVHPVSVLANKVAMMLGCY
jgi:two-component system chemotaxis response regulator CheB